MFISSKKGKFTKVGIESKYLFENIWRGELNDSFDMVRSQILLMDPLPPLNKVFSMVIQHERQFVTSNSGLELEDSKVSVNASDSRRSQGRGKGGYNGQSNSGPKKRYSLTVVKTTTLLIIALILVKVPMLIVLMLMINLILMMLEAQKVQIPTPSPRHGMRN
jgi:hypothetical protein